MLLILGVSAWVVFTPQFIVFRDTERPSIIPWEGNP